MTCQVCGANLRYLYNRTGSRGEVIEVYQCISCGTIYEYVVT